MLHLTGQSTMLSNFYVLVDDNAKLKKFLRVCSDHMSKITCCKPPPDHSSRNQFDYFGQSKHGSSAENKHAAVLLSWLTISESFYAFTPSCSFEGWLQPDVRIVQYCPEQIVQKPKHMRLVRSLNIKMSKA
jgi:hypothetical protein